MCAVLAGWMTLGLLGLQREEAGIVDLRGLFARAGRGVSGLQRGVGFGRGVLATAMAGAVLVTMGAGVAPPAAAQILSRPAVSEAAPRVSVGCSAAALIAAIGTANSVGGATMDLTPRCTYVLTGPDNYWYGPNGLPAIASAVTIDGHGATVARSTATGTAAFRLFYVGADPNNSRTLGYTSPGAGKLTLENLTLTGGLAQGGGSSRGGGGAGMGGAIFNQGQLVLDAVTATANTAHGGDIDAGGSSNKGGGIGTGGGFGGTASFGGATGGMGTCAPGGHGRGGGGGGFVAGTDNGLNASPGTFAAGGGPKTGLGGGYYGGDGSGGGNLSSYN
ncbi:MAG: hypothetical protein M3256_27175, partial [Actinomycetota bacterium]|nr:hypothetical protein [Actinomycetota bacterium]